MIFYGMWRLLYEVVHAVWGGKKKKKQKEKVAHSHTRNHIFGRTWSPDHLLHNPLWEIYEKRVFECTYVIHTQPYYSVWCRCWDLTAGIWRRKSFPVTFTPRCETFLSALLCENRSHRSFPLLALTISSSCLRRGSGERCRGSEERSADWRRQSHFTRTPRGSGLIYWFGCRLVMLMSTTSHVGHVVWAGIRGWKLFAGWRVKHLIFKVRPPVRNVLFLFQLFLFKGFMLQNEPHAVRHY